VTSHAAANQVAPIDTLSDLELDALTELVNLGVNRSAANLREMVNRPVLLSVPGVAIVSRSDATRLLHEREPGPLVGIHQDFKGDIEGKTLLIFPNRKSLDLVRAVTDESLPDEDIVALQHEALAEIGNVVLNGCFATIANLLRRNFRMSLPELERGDASALLKGDSDEVILFLYIDFTIQDRDVHGYIALLMDVPSFGNLKSLLAEFIERIS
jgi:chemotaxis protein CheC